MDYETMYGQLITTALPGVSFPSDYNFVAKHKSNMTRVRKQAQVDVTLERDVLRKRFAEIDRRYKLRAKAKKGEITDKELDELGSMG